MDTVIIFILLHFFVYALTHGMECCCLDKKTKQGSLQLPGLGGDHLWLVDFLLCNQRTISHGGHKMPKPWPTSCVMVSLVQSKEDTMDAPQFFFESRAKFSREYPVTPSKVNPKDVTLHSLSLNTSLCGLGGYGKGTAKNRGYGDTFHFYFT